MKKLIYCALALAAGLFATSCQQENLEPVAQEGTVTYTIEVPEVVTKAIADGKNVNRLFYEVYVTTSEGQDNLFENANLLYKKDVAMESVTGPTARTSVTLNLLQNQYYTVLFWAQCGEAEAGLYNVNDLRAVTYREGVAVKANHEDYAAFYAVDCISDKTPRSKTVYLKRPFAQLNIGTLNTVGNEEYPYTVTMTQSKVTVKKVPTVFNVATSEVDGETDFTFAWESLDLINEQLVVNTQHYDYIAMNYMFAGENRTATVEYELEAVMTTEGNVEVPADLAKTVVNVPLKENYRTNIVGNLLTNATEYEVIVDADWAGADLAPEALYLAAANGGEVTLTEDVTLDKPLNIYADMSLNLNGNTINGTLNVAKGVAFVIENGKVVNTDKTVSGITSNGILTLNNVEIESARHALRIESGSAVINGGTYEVNPISASTLYALNVGDGANSIANVTVKGGTFIGPKGTMADSGGAVTVKVGSTVKIEGGDFSGGKSKTLSADGTLTVAGGSYDQNPEAYVAEGYKAVEKDGKWYVVAEETDAVVATKNELKDALTAAVNNGETNVVVDANGANIGNLDYGLTKTNVPAGTTVTIKNANITDQSYGNAVDGTVIFENCTFNADVYSIHFDAGNGDVIFKNCDLYGWNSFGATLNSVSFENCTLSGNGAYALIRSYADLYVDNLIVNTANANHNDNYSEGVEAVSGASLTANNLVYVVENDEALAREIATAKTDKVILLAEGTYSQNIDLTVAALGEANGDLVFKAAEGAEAVISGTVTLGYRKQGTGATMWNGNVTFEGVTFDHAEAAKHSIDVQDVKSLTLKNCKIIGDGEYGIGSASGNATGASTIQACTFENAGMQLLGNFATGLVIDDCTFNGSCVNVQGGNGVTVQNCTFNNTLKSAHVGDSFYCVRSNSTPITVKDTEINIDSELTEVATSQAKWYLLANRGTTDWTVENVAVTMTDAALQQTELQVVACTSTGLINTNNLTVNGFPYGISQNSEGVYVADPTVAGTLNWLESNEPEIFLNGKVQYGSVLYTYANDGANVTMAVATEEAKTLRGLVGSSVTNATVSEGIKVIGDRTFRDAPNMKTISLPSSLTTIENDAFQKAYALEEITIPENVTSIGSTCFGSCSSLEKIIINATNITFHNYCARACANLKEVFIYSDEIEFGTGSMYFTNKESGDASAITFYVKNKEIADEFYAGMKTSHSYGMKIVSINGNTEFYNTLK